MVIIKKEDTTMKRCYGIFNKQLILPTSFRDCLTYGQIQNLMIQKIEELEEKVATLESEVAQLKSDQTE